MTRSESIAKLAAALAAAQGEMTAIVKDKTAKVQTKSGASYSFDYADLGSVLDAVKPALNKHGIALLQPGRVEGDKVITETVLAHSSGEWISSEFAVKPDDLSPQKVGSALTYGRRYALSAMIGVFSEEDDDGNAASGNERTVQRKAPTSAPRPAAKPLDTKGALQVLVVDVYADRIRRAKDLAELENVAADLKKDGQLTATDLEKLRDEYALRHEALKVAA